MKKIQNLKFDHVRIPKYNDVFAKEYAPNWGEEIFVVKKIRIQYLGFM